MTGGKPSQCRTLLSLTSRRRVFVRSVVVVAMEFVPNASPSESLNFSGGYLMLSADDIERNSHVPQSMGMVRYKCQLLVINKYSCITIPVWKAKHSC